MCYVGVELFALYGTGSSSSFISNVACSGTESRLTDCTYDNTALTGCNDVGVLCEGSYIAICMLTYCNNVAT